MVKFGGPGKKKAVMIPEVVCVEGVFCTRQAFEKPINQWQVTCHNEISLCIRIFMAIILEVAVGGGGGGGGGCT